jgi:glyoxylase-like metal-dependent hydrolase (beta-lactamase superfamily II)
VGLAVVEKGHFWLMAGDATFDSDQTLRGGITAVSQNLSQARETQAVLKRMLDSGKITLLPAHDPEVFARLTKTQLSQGRVTQKTKRSASIQGRWR